MSAQDVRERVRQWVLDGLSRRSADPDAPRAVMRDAMVGLGGLWHDGTAVAARCGTPIVAMIKADLQGMARVCRDRR